MRPMSSRMMRCLQWRKSKQPGITTRIPPEAFYYEPFYHLMRQTLLGAKMVEKKDKGCADYQHIHVIPSKNTELLERVTSPYLKGNNITEAWKSALKNPDKYRVISPKDFLAPCMNKEDSKSFLSYLQKRYW